MKQAREVVTEAVVAPLPQPALNKWTRLGPTIARVVLMSHFCGVLGHAMKQEFGGLAERVEEEENREQEEQQAEAVGLPLDERAAWKRVADKRRLKAAEFVQDKDASWGNLMWLVIASPILVLHWKLFKHAKWSTEMDPRKHEEPGRILKEFCIPSLNPAGKVMESLMAILQDASQALRVVFFFHGPLERWSEKRKKTVQQLVLVAVGQLWRKLVMPWQAYPWRLWPLIWGESEEEKVAAAQALLAQRECCLDACFTGKLRALAGSAEFLLEHDAQEFLRTVFTRHVATSTFVERRFASYGAWVARRSSAPRLATLAAKHVTSCMKEFVAHWRDRARQVPCASARSRPIWETSAQKGLRSTGLHLFSQEFKKEHEQRLRRPADMASYTKDVREAWSQLSDERRRQFSQQAREKNALAAARKAADASREQEDGGPWNMARLQDKWPLNAGIVEGALQSSSFTDLWAQWKAEHCTAEAEAENVSEPGENAVKLFSACLPQACEAALSASQRAARGRIQANIGTLVRARNPLPNQLGEGPLLLRFHGPSGQVCDFLVAFATRTTPPECAMLQLESACSDTLQVPRVADRAAWLAAFRTDHGVAVFLAQIAAEWSVGVLHCGDPGRDMHRFFVVREEHFSQTDLDATRRDALRQDAALRAVRAARAQRQKAKQQQRPSKDRVPTSKSKKTQAKAAQASAQEDAVASSDASEVLPDSGSESDGSVVTWPASDLEDTGADVVQSLAMVLGGEVATEVADRAVRSLRTEHEPAPVPDPPAPIARRPGGSRPGRSWRRRGEQWGPFTLSPIVRSADGVVTGWGAICGLHKDLGADSQQAQCKKAASLSQRAGAPSEQELRLRLKRWLLTGLMDSEDWPADAMRRTHVGLQLADLADGPSEQDMDEWMQGFVANLTSV